MEKDFKSYQFAFILYKKDKSYRNNKAHVNKLPTKVSLLATLLKLEFFLVLTLTTSFLGLLLCKNDICTRAQMHGNSEISHLASV